MAKVGRPTVYRKEYCQQLIDYMKQGHSFETFGVDLDVSIDTLYKWLAKYPEFSEARTKGLHAAQKTLESLGMMIASGKVKGTGTGAWIFLMKNKFKWQDRVEVTGSADKPIQLKYALDGPPQSSNDGDSDGDKVHPRKETRNGKED